MTRSTVSLAAAIAGALALAAPAHAVIELDRSMGNATLGQPAGEVLKTAGDPTTNVTVRNRNGSPELQYYYAATKTKIVFYNDPEQNEWTVLRLITRRGVERTPERAGVGTPERVLRRRVRGLSCRSLAGTRVCFTKGRPLDPFGIDQTQFTVSRRTRRVTRVVVGRFYD